MESRFLPIEPDEIKSISYKPFNFVSTVNKDGLGDFEFYIVGIGDKEEYEFPAIAIWNETEIESLVDLQTGMTYELLETKSEGFECPLEDEPDHGEMPVITCK